MSEITVVPRWLCVLCFVMVVPFLLLAMGRVLGLEVAMIYSFTLAPLYTSEQLPLLPILPEYSHRVVGTLALIVGTLLFSPWIRGFSVKLHKMLGKVYVGLILAVDLSGFRLIFQPFGDWIEVVSTFVFGWLMLVETLIAVWFITKRNNEQHHLYMLRGFAILYGNVTIRLLYVPLWNYSGFTEREVIGPGFLIGWSLNALVMEYLIHRYHQKKASWA